jgi:hypothetical protein
MLVSITVTGNVEKDLENVVIDVASGGREST